MTTHPLSRNGGKLPRSVRESRKAMQSFSKRSKSFLLLALVILGCSAQKEATTASEPQLATFTILHWNDFHAQNVPFKVVVKDTVKGVDSSYYVGGTATLLGYIKDIKGNRSDVAVFNAGDDFQGTPISSITNGRSQIELMNIINPDAMTLGNHEFDYGLENLEENLRLARFPIINANIFDQRKGKHFLEPYLVKTFGRVRAGIIGLIVPDLPILTIREQLQGLEMLDHIQVVRKYVAELKKEGIDLIIVLSHIGVDVDQAVADSVPDVNVIVGGHSHTPIFTPIKRNRTVISQAGTRGRWLGKLDLTVDLEGDSLYNYEGQLIETVVGRVAPDPEAEAKVSELEKSVAKELGEVIGMLDVDWIRKFNAESNIGNWSADAMREFAQTDFAFLNSGSLRKDLYAGEITIRDIWEIHPFNNHLVKFRVSGKMLRGMMAWQAAGRGEFMQVSGIRYRYDSSRLPEERLLSVEVNGQQIEDERIYSIATNNYVAGHLHAFFGLHGKEIEVTPLQEIDRDLFSDAIKKQGHVTSSIEARIVDAAKR